MAGEPRTFGFFQLDMHGGIFHSCCSLTDTCKQLQITQMYNFAPNYMAKSVCIQDMMIVLINAHLSCGRVQNRCRRGRRTTRDFRIRLELWWLHWILLCLNHSNNPLFSTGVVAYALLSWCVADVLGRCCLIQCSDWQGGRDLLLNELLKS